MAKNQTELAESSGLKREPEGLKPMEEKTETAENEIGREFEGRATYSPEDNKLRLYVGRVPREEYLKLRAEGWKALHKQREAGGGDFVATWTPERRDTALEYAGIIEDEDMGPEERAADRAERFGGYRDKRMTEAGGSADSYDAGPSAHGYQSEARAARAVRRHDRLAARSVDSWDKAEYWQQRTAGVIGHALYVSSPGVRMGRIKKLETDLRRASDGGEWFKHLTLRLAYENQMLEATGGRASLLEIEVGGWFGQHQIRKVVKSPTTKQVVSVEVMASTHTYKKGERVPITAPILYNIERTSGDEYRPPTDEDHAAMAVILAAERKARKASAPPTIPLVNPTDADAERLQAIWNKQNARWIEKDEPPKPVRLAQAVYSKLSLGSYGAGETMEITGGGFQKRNRGHMGNPDCPFVAKVRSWRHSVVILADKPQKGFADSVWHDPRPAMVEALAAEFSALDAALRLAWLPEMGTPERDLIQRAWTVGLAYVSSMSQYGFTDKGEEWAKQQREKTTAPAFTLEVETVNA